MNIGIWEVIEHIYPSLLRNNWLRVFYKSDKLLPKRIFPRAVVSDKFKYLLLDLLEDHTFSEVFDDKEKELFDSQIKCTKIDVTSNRILRAHKQNNVGNNKS